MVLTFLLSYIGICTSSVFYTSEIFVIEKKMFCMLVCFNCILILVLEILFFVVTAKITIDDIVAIN